MMVSLESIVPCTPISNLRMMQRERVGCDYEVYLIHTENVV